ncbi:MAG: hypothetical protein K9H84_03670 [Bacteroidales bacterium]|nr:hypothetical protein [Bacteroidales bacterium]
MSRIRIIIIASAVAVAGIITIFALPEKQKLLTVAPEFRKYVSAFTSGIIHKDDNIRIKLRVNYADSGMIGKPVERSLFEISPEVKGKGYWINSSTFEFRPNKNLESGRLYNAKFFLSKLIDIPKEFKTLEFSFKTMQQSLELSIQQIKTLPGKQKKWQKLEGQLRLADIEDIKNIKNVVTANHKGSSKDITWTKTKTPRLYNFVIDSIPRLIEKSHLTIKWNGKPISSPQKGKKIIEITRLGTYKLRTIRTYNEPEQCILLEFSDPIDTKQDLNGLINIPGVKLHTVVDRNIIKAYPQVQLSGKKKIYISNGIKNHLGKTLSEPTEYEINFRSLKPEIRLKGKGVILPGSEKLLFSFEAVNLRAVDLTVYRIYENNILQFLQENDLNENSNLSRVSKIIYQGVVPLNSAEQPVINYSQWNDYSIDLKKFIQPAKGAIYRDKLNIRKEFSTYPCDGQEQTNMISLLDNEQKNTKKPEYDDWAYQRMYDDYGNYPSDYSWRERDNPCHNSYYYRKTYAKNILASDIGMMVKRGNDDKTIVFATDLISAQPLSGITIKAYDYQQQLIRVIQTNSEGKAEFSGKKPFVIVAENNDERGYLKLNDGLSNSLSKFDISGSGLKEGLNGFIYGERDVWRPGDTLFISFMLEDKLNKLPEDVPVVCEFYTPHEQLYQRLVNNKAVNNIYTYKLKTNPEDQTGMWRIKINIGHAEFTKYVRIETIKPNRLDIQLNFSEEKIKQWDLQPGKLHVQWLHGGKASRLKAVSEVTLNPLKADFKNYKQFTFQDPSRSFSAEKYTVYEGITDKNGKAVIIPDFHLQSSSPGILNARFETRVFEKSGNPNVSIDNFTYYPYRSYAGINIPGGQNWFEPLETGKNNTIELCNVDADGKDILSNELKITVYKLSHSWWYDYSGNRLKRLLNDRSSEPYTSGTVKVRNGKATFNFRVNKPDYGRYFIRVTDLTSAHSSGRLVYFSGSNWWQKDKNKDFASLLIFNSDKEQYQSGQQVELRIPSSESSKILISLENGMEVLKTEWIEGSEDKTIYRFEATKDMAPTVYAHVTLLQPHAQTENDLPIRLYGVIPIQVEEKATHLYPQIKCSESFKPESKARITISEKNGKPMAYTLAIVDEGLLNLTNFKTPDPWKYFYQRKALGVKTWDIYDYVIGAFDGDLNRILSVGGDSYAQIDTEEKETNRFKPVVRFLGPFKSGANEHTTHTIDIPQYIGKVRIMAVAKHNEAYGHAKKNVEVKSPVMAYATLPRVLSPGEDVILPVNIFAMEDQINNISVNVKASDIFKIEDSRVKTVNFEQRGDKLINFKLKVKDAIGNGTVEVNARSGNHSATYTINIQVKNPNPLISNTTAKVIEGNKKEDLDYKPLGMKGTNKAILEISGIPPLDLSRRMEYLIRYPYGCIEQTTSSAFPQLFLDQFMELTNREQQDISRNIKATVHSIKRMQLSNGAFSYWPGSSSASLWGTSYAGHFLLEAREKGYNIPGDVIQKWYNYQLSKANRWTMLHAESPRSDLIQAYRLYTLAIYGEPAIGAMNRLKASGNLKAAASWMLAATYAKAGMKNTAKQVLVNAPEKIKPYHEYSYTFGSHIRDYSIIIEALILTGQSGKAFTYIREISKKLSSDQWLSTQTIAFSLVAISSYIEHNKIGKQLNYEVTINGKTSRFKQKKPFSQQELKAGKEQRVSIHNLSGGNLYVRLIRMGQPLENPIQSDNKNLFMDIQYQDMEGKPIDPVSLEQGTDFVAEVKIKHPGNIDNYKELALEQVFPSGWEITGMRLNNGSIPRSNTGTYKYRDIRDDRVFTFFDLTRYETKTFRIMLNASYLGRFYHPVNQCKTMYSDDIYSYKSGYWVKVVHPQ